MHFKTPLINGTFLRRYKRFLADVRLETGEVVTAHCTNSGSMKSCLEPGAAVYLSPAMDPKRKTQFTWEMIQINGGWVGINTLNPNRIAYDAIVESAIPGLTGYTEVTREVTYGDSRLDIMARNSDHTCFIEVKNVTMREDGMARFPDAITTRGLKHLETLLKIKESGMRAVMLYIIQRMDVDGFGPASDIDPAYATGLKKAFNLGVEIIPLRVKVSPDKIVIDKIIPFLLKG